MLAAVLLATGVGALAPQRSVAATAAVVVTATVPSATSMTATLCQTGQAGRTSFGNVIPGTSNVTTADCEVGFNSSNDSSMLRLYQQDGYDTAMARSGWTLRNSGVTTTWEGVDFAPGSGSRAWIIGGGGAIRITNDGGTTWAAQTSNSGGNSLKAVDATSSTDAWSVGGSGTVVRTTGGGVTWSLASATIGTAANLFRVSAVDASTAWVAGNGGVVRRTTNGGGSWTNQDTCAGTNVRALNAPNASDVWLACENGSVFHSANGGTVWTAVTTPDPGNYGRGIWALDGSTAWIGTTTGKVMKTTNGGTSWTTQTTVGGVNIEAIKGLDATTLWAVSDIQGYVLRTTDGGTTWTQEFQAGGTLQLDGIAVSDAGRAIASGWDTGSVTGRVYATPTDPIPDYNSVTANWLGATSMFGACLRAVSGGASTNGTTWTADPSGDCTGGDADPWMPITGTASKVARVAAAQAGFGIADLRFGMRVANNQVPGVYRAPLTLEVLAPEF